MARHHPATNHCHQSARCHSHIRPHPLLALLQLFLDLGHLAARGRDGRRQALAFSRPVGAGPCLAIGAPHRGLELGVTVLEVRLEA